MNVDETAIARGQSPGNEPIDAVAHSDELQWEDEQHLAPAMDYSLASAGSTLRHELTAPARSQGEKFGRGVGWFSRRHKTDSAHRNAQVRRVRSQEAKMYRAKYPKARQASRGSGEVRLTSSEASNLGFSSRHRERLVFWCSLIGLSWLYIAWTLWGYSSAPLYGSVEGNRALLESSPIGAKEFDRSVWREARSLSASFSGFIDGDLRRDRAALEDLIERRVEARIKAAAVSASGDTDTTAGAGGFSISEESERLVQMGELERAMRDVVRRCTALLDETFDRTARLRHALIAMTRDVENVIELLESLKPDSAASSSQWGAVLEEAWRIKEAVNRDWRSEDSDIPLVPDYGESNHG